MNRLYNISYTITITLLFLLVSSLSHISAANAKTLYLYNWSDYMPKKILKAFEDKYNVKVSVSYLSNSQQLFAKLHAGGDRQYDIVVPSNFIIPRMIHAGLLQPLDKKLIPNLNNLLPRFKNPSYDPHNQYSVPYQWGDAGIAYNSEDIPDPPHSWSLIFDPKVNPKYPFLMNKSDQGAMGIACLYVGFEYNCIGAKKWKKAAEQLIKMKNRPNFSGFEQGNPTLKQLARGSVSAGVVYNGDYIKDKLNDPKAFSDIKFFVPKEGSEIWMDTMAIPAHAPHPYLANKFINFMLEPKIGAELSNYNKYPSPNKASQPYLNEALSKPPIMPPESTMKKLEFSPTLKGKQHQLLEQLWTRVLSE